jgi:hypothetical protein
MRRNNSPTYEKIRAPSTICIKERGAFEISNFIRRVRRLTLCNFLWDIADLGMSRSRWMHFSLGYLLFQNRNMFDRNR